MPLSEKHRDFVCEPMGDKSVYRVPGIGRVTGDNMSRDGIKTAKALYGYFMADQDTFKDKVMSYGANTSQQEAAYRAMKEYAEQHS